ncbi:hypothetical protein DFH09DRAFT_1474015 [Mycena vulgaris]|nr:hypothetical protein DFH09DRAFT_1474015 [Mycena vulgaris]
MFLSVALPFVLAASSAVVTLPPSPSGSANALVDIHVAAATAAYAIPDNSTFGNATDPHNVTSYINAYDSHDYHVGRYPASEFFAAATAAAAAKNCGPITTEQLVHLPGYYIMDANIRRDISTTSGGPQFQGYQLWTTNEVHRFLPAFTAGVQIGFACAGTGPFQVEAGVPAQCDEVEAKTEAIVRGTTGRVRLEYKTGRQSGLTLTTTKSSTLSVGVTVSVGIEIKIFSAGASTTVEQSVTNEESSRSCGSFNAVERAELHCLYYNIDANTYPERLEEVDHGVEGDYEDSEQREIRFGLRPPLRERASVLWESDFSHALQGPPITG